MGKKFVVHKELNLGFLGQGWDKCSATFQPFTYNEIQEISALEAKESEGTEEEQREAKEKSVLRMMDLIKGHFVKGTGLIEGGQVVEITADDLGDLPVEFIGQAIKTLSGGIDPKS